MASRLWACAAGVLLAGCGGNGSSDPGGPTPPQIPAKVYVALEDGNAVAVLDGGDLHILKLIPFEEAMPHNVQVAPDGASVWVTLPAMPMEGMTMDDEVAVIDPTTDAVVARVDLGPGVDPAHVVVSADGATAFVTGATNNELIRIDGKTHAVIDRTPLGHGSGAHGERLSADGSTVWIAEIGGHCVDFVPSSGGTPDHVMLNGEAIQVAVTPDGRFVFATQYDTKQVARIDTRTHEVTYVALPAAAQGPAQIYPTPDGRSMIVADQGLLEGRPASDLVVFVDVENAIVTDGLLVQDGAHGVVTSGDRAYVTSAKAGTLSAIDLRTHTLVASVHVGDGPNGVSAWSDGRGTP